MFKVETGIEIQKPKRGAPHKYPFPEMAVGDSFHATGKDARSAPAAASKYGQVHGMKFSVRTVDGGKRIWRIE